MTSSKYKYVKGVQCPICEQKMWSKYRHDFKYCECGYTMVDGGRSYLRFGWGVQFENNENTAQETYDIANEFNSYIGKPKQVRIRVPAEQIVKERDTVWPY